jgi:hypothetical protein
MTKYNIVVFILVLFSRNELISQNFNRQDTLRGSITPERAWWDLKYYHLDIAVEPSDSSIRGKNTVLYKVLKEAPVMQIDLQEPLILEKPRRRIAVVSP